MMREMCLKLMHLNQQCLPVQVAFLASTLDTLENILLRLVLIELQYFICVLNIKYVAISSFHTPAVLQETLERNHWSLFPE